jgi:hypothetical protein
MDKIDKNRLVVVLGMHRSGTSAITKSLELLGVGLGDDLHPPGFDNPKGFWEDRECIEINDKLLSHFGSAYDRLGLAWDEIQTDSQVSELKLKAAQLISRKLIENNGIWGFKDPRICRLLVFWNEVFLALNCEVSFVIAVRNPASVAASLAARNNIPAEKAYFLWLQHVLPALSFTKGTRRIVVDYDELLENPYSQVVRISSKLGLQLPDRQSSLVRDFENNFLERELRHTSFTEAQLSLDSRAPRMVTATYNLLHRLARDQESLEGSCVQVVLDELDARLREASPAFDYINILEDERMGLWKSVADCESRITISQQSLLERKSRINNLNRSLIEAHRLVELTHSLEEKLRCSELKITEIFASTSWKASEPLRALSRLFRKLNITSVVPLEVGGAAQQIAERESSLIASGFDAEFYRKAYPDLCGCDLFAHYSEYGKNEGRLPCAPDLIMNCDLKNLDRSKETVLIVSHEASRTGAPVLALNIAQHLKEKYNVIVFLLGGGGLLAGFQECCDIVVEPFPQAHNPFITSTVLTKLISQVDLKFAIVNSIVSKSVLSPLANHFVPSLCLIHEFASYTSPKNAIREVVLWASQIVFSARIVYENNAAQCVELKGSCPVILPQGKCEVPYSKDNERLDENQSQRIRKMFRPDSLPDNSVVILGAGFVHIRKGVDLFLACAARVVGLHPKNTFRFVWVGGGFDPDLDMGYSVYLQDQITRSGLENHVCFTGELSDIDMAYELSDVLLLSSRLDPLPNVAIDAMSKQLPVICFDNTTGIADLLKENGLGEACVIPYLDIELAAQRLVALIEDSEQRNRLGKEIKEVGEKLFDMRSYVESLEGQVLNCVVMQETEKSDCTLIENDGALDLDFYLPPSWSALSDREAVRAFVRSWKSGIDMRKPFPGFHPGIYADCHGLSQTGKNPLAAFIEAGKTEGPWLYDLIPPSSPVQMRNKLPLRVALHIHVFFVDLFLDILQRLEGQEFQLDLLISVPSLEVAEEVSFMVSGYTNGTVDIRTVPNRGRDIGPLLTEFNATILKNYDVIGHVHTKKSGDVKDAAMGQSWLNFLLENLIGKRYPMASTILERMAGDKQLGLVFPDDPWVVGWSGNKEIAEDLAHQFGINELPGHHLNFPVGTMFWARTEALKPLLTKGFRWEDFPEEPLPYDGTVLHALERLLPFVAKKTGYHVAMTHVSGITR